jgi:hypothetical protein
MRDHRPGFIDWATFEANQARLVMKGRSGGSIERILSILPAAQNRVAKALIAGPEAKTYTFTAELGVQIGTIHQHLRRIRNRHPEVYSALMVVRRQQLTERHERALGRAREHDAWWFRQPGYLQCAPDA